MTDDNSTLNRRTQRRRTLSGSVNIVNQHDGTVLGRLVNITTEGLMLVNATPLASDALFQAVLELPETLNNTNRIELGMDCLWTSPTEPDADMYWSGCHIIDISEEMFATLVVLIENFGD